MASLALVVTLMFLSALFVGPICYLISSFKFVPDWVVWIFSIFAMFVGAYWFILPTGILRFVGLFSIYLGFLSLRKRMDNANISDYNS